MSNKMMEALGEAPPTSVESLVTEDAIEKALREVLPSMDADTATLKAVMQKLAVRFGMEFLDLKAQWRPQIKALLPELLEVCLGGAVAEKEAEKVQAEEQEEEEEEFDLRPTKRNERTTKRNTVVDASDEEEDDPSDEDASDGEDPTPEDDEDEDVAPPKKRRTMSEKSTRKRKNNDASMPAKKLKTTKEADPRGLAALKELGRAAGILNPQLYKVLKGASPSETEDILRERLQDANVTFQGAYPSSRDISAAKRKHAKEKDLEGIDTSLIITGGRSRRGGRERISYREERISGEEDNDEDEDEDDREADEDDSAGSDSSEASF